MSSPRRAWPAAAVIALVATLLATTVDTVPAAAAAPPARDATAALPDDWTIEPGSAGPELVWRGADVRMGGARPEVRIGARLLGFARDDDGSLRLPITASDAAAVRSAPDELAVWAAGRRLDGAPTARSAGPDHPPARVTPTPSSRIDPAARGQYRTARRGYDLAPLARAEYEEPMEVVAEVTLPVGAPGRRPLVLILHGRHGTCFTAEGDAGGSWPCPEGWAPIDSHLGYRYLADRLASQGFIAVSIAANAINGQDWVSPDGGAAARSQLVRHHLRLWHGWNQRGGGPWQGANLRGRVDLSNVVLVGHSRGGEGVHRAAIDTVPRDPWRIRGLVTYGPTAFGRQVTPDVPSVTILPACDGDVSDLQGQAYVDTGRDVASSTALRSAVLALGANHNYFNTEWTPGLATAPASDDWYDPEDSVCGDQGSLRLSPQEQQRVGAAYTLALVRSVVDRDRAMLRLLDGSKLKPAAIGRAEVSVSAVGGNSILLYRPEAPGEPWFTTGMRGHECQGYEPGAMPWERAAQPTCGAGLPFELTPHWQPMDDGSTRPAPVALDLEWSGRGAAILPVRRGGTGLDLSKQHAIDVRVANDPRRAPARLAVRVRDVDGHTAMLGSDLSSIDGWPGTGILDRVQARTLRARLVDVAGVDLSRVAAVELVGTGDGHVWVLDVHAVRRGPTTPVDLDLPVVSVDAIEVLEGGPGERQAFDVPIRVEGRVRRAATVWVQVRTPNSDGGEEVRGFPLQLRPGISGVVSTVPLSFVGDELYEPDPFAPRFDVGKISLAAVSGVATGDYIGGVSTIEDDPLPALSVDAAEVSAPEGDSLVWTLRLSGPTTGAFYRLGAEPPPDGATELDTGDVDQPWLRERLESVGVDLEFPIEPPMQLSSVGRDWTGVGLMLFAFFDYGETTTEVEIPLRADRQAEGDEQTVLDIIDFEGDPTIPPGGLRLTGRVDANSPTDGLPAWSDTAVPIDGPFGDSPSEEAAIDPIVEGASVVLAGRMSRGADEVERLLSGLVIDLIERKGVTTVLLDEPVATSVAAARFVLLGEGSAAEAVAAFTDPLHRTAEAVVMLEAIRQHNESAPKPVLVIGVAPGSNPSALVDVLADFDPTVAHRVGCFDLDAVAVQGWATHPESERNACRDELLAAASELAGSAAGAVHDEAGIPAILAHTAAEALVAAEGMASVDPTSVGAVDEVASRRAEGLAAGIAAAVTREPDARLVAVLDDLDAAVLRDVVEPRVIPGTDWRMPSMTSVTVRASVAALLVDALGDDAVATIGTSVGGGQIRAYAVFEDRSLSRQFLARPIRGTLDRALSAFGPDDNAFIVPSSDEPSFAPVLPARIGVRSDYLAVGTDDWYVPISPASAYDGIMHVRAVDSAVLLAERPRLELDGVAVELDAPCFDTDDGAVSVTFPTGRLGLWIDHDETGELVATVTVVHNAVSYTGHPELRTSEGWDFVGTLRSTSEATLDVSGYLPGDVPICGGRG